MSMDRYFTLVDGIWVGSDYDFNEPLFAQFWVEMYQGMDERYYFADFDSALDFYLEGWKERRFTFFKWIITEEGVRKLIPDGVAPLCYIGLYARGGLIHGCAWPCGSEPAANDKSELGNQSCRSID